MKHLLLLIAALLFSQFIFAQSQSIQGKIYDDKTEEGLPFANVVLLQNGIQKAGTTTDLDGNYSFTGFDSGTYDILAIYVGYPDEKITRIQVSRSQTVSLDVGMNEGIMLTGGGPIGYPIPYKPPLIDDKIPLIDHRNTSTDNTMDSREISRMPF